MKFYYMDGGKKKYITLKRASPEWCNLDCPTIYIDKAGYWPGWRLCTGLVLEDGNTELIPLLRGFICKSSEAFYSKYPNCRSVPGKNGFIENFEMTLKAGI